MILHYHASQSQFRTYYNRHENSSLTLYDVKDLLPRYQGQALASNEKENKNAPVRRPPPPTPAMRPKADHDKSGSRSSPLSIQPSPRERDIDRPPCGGCESIWEPGRVAMARMPLHSRAAGIGIINQGRICSCFGENRDWDKHYRNDSLEYCRHEEKKRKRNPSGGRESTHLYTLPRVLWVPRSASPEVG